MSSILIRRRLSHIRPNSSDNRRLVEVYCATCKHGHYNGSMNLNQYLSYDSRSVGRKIPTLYLNMPRPFPLLDRQRSLSLKLYPVGTRLFSNTVKFTFVEEKDPSVQIQVEGEVDSTVLDVALKHNIDIEGACGGEMACSTCHVILSEDLFNRLPAKSEEEQDMLDLAWGLQPTSRLCCQIKVNNLLEGEILKVPADTNNMF